MNCHLRISLLSMLPMAAMALFSTDVRGDVFFLRSGGRVEGEWLNRGDSLQAPYHVKTTAGLTLQVERQSVERVISQRDDEVAYQSLAPKVADTIEEQWKLAQWCRERHLTDERAVHLERIIQLDPDHLPARRALGYAQVEGQWLTRDQWRRRQGYEYYRGRWRLPQEIDILEAYNQRNLAEKQWLARIRNWREMLVTEDAVEARDALLAINDAQAVATLAEFLQKDQLRGAKMIYITVLKNIGTSAAIEALLTASLDDNDEEIRVACLDAIEQLDPPGAVRIYVIALENANNFRVNRAAFALGRLGDDSVAASLIDALVTMHTFHTQPNNNASPDTVTTSFVNEQRADASGRPRLIPSRGSGMSVGDGKKTFTRRIPNEEALAALLKLTGGPNYGYNQPAWRQWLESRIQSSGVDDLRQ